MRLCLQCYFDVGATYGLDDSLFRKSSVPDIRKVGIWNPLGEGIRFDLATDEPRILEVWRSEAVAKVDDPEMELGFSADAATPEQNEARREQFLDRVREVVEQVEIARCDITLYAIGTAFLDLELGPTIPLQLVRAVHRCFEYAAYMPAISSALLAFAREKMKSMAGPALDRLQKLTRRPEPKTPADESGYEEWHLITGFTPVVLCIDPSDRPDAVLRAVEPLATPGANDERFVPVVFEYHGTLHYNWSACVVEPRPAENRTDEPRDEMERILACIRIAHTFLGTCEAYENLVLAETIEKAGAFLRDEAGGLDTRALNRLRTVALAVVGLTNFAQITQSGEDQAYFALFEANALISAKHRLIQDRCDILYNVQSAETAAEESARAAQDERQQRRLNAVLLVLTNLTFISILADSYTFLESNEHHLIPSMTTRSLVLVGVVVALLGVFAGLQLLFRSGRTR